MRRNFFADSDFLTGYFSRRDEWHELAIRIFRYLQRTRLISDLCDFHISNYVIMEVLHNLQNKEIPFQQIEDTYETLNQCHVFHVKPRDIEQAFETKLKPYLNHRTQSPPIGVVDATSLVIMDKKRISSLISFDDGFDALPDIFIRIHNIDVIEQRILQYR